MNIRPARSMLTLALIDAANVKTIATEEIPVSTVDDDQLLDAVTERAVRWLGFELTPESIRALAGGASCLPETNPLYRQARGYLMRYEVVGNLIIAADQFKKVTEKDPRCAPAFAGWGAACLRLYQSTGQREYLNEGLKAAQQAIQLSRESPEVHITMGALLREMGQREEALKEFNEALRLDPQKAETHRELGTTYAALKDPAKAEKAYQMAITLDPNSWSGYSHLGVFYLFQGRYKEAAKNFKEVIVLTPDNPRGLTNLATAYFYLYDLPSAIQTQERAVNLVPTPQACNNLGFYYYFSRRYVDAARMFERAVEKADRRTLYRGNLADAYRHIPGQEEKARPTYEKAIAMAREELSVSPNNTELLRFLARYYAQTGRPEDALAAIARAQDLSPQSPAVMESSVQVYEILGKRDDALKALERLIRAKGSLQVVVLEPDLENLRQDSRYRAMMKSVEGVPSPK
jgi:tetratricopeptide (TPR) repeat protein